MDRMPFQRRLPVTLLELLIVMAVLALVSGVVAISINKAIVDQRFRTEAALVADELRLAQDLMLILGADVRVLFEEMKEQAGIQMSLEMDTEVSKSVQRELTKRVHNLKTIKGLFFSDQLHTETKKGMFDVKFLSNGAVMSRGVMRLSTSDRETPSQGTLESYICLPGYPKPIKSSETKEEADKICEKADAAFFERLTIETMQKIPEKAKAKPSEEPDQSNSSDSEKQPRQTNGKPLPNKKGKGS